MILSRTHRFVFISTPKTGSHTFFKLLRDEFDGERLGPSFHRTEMPARTEGYTIFSTCRNPYDRLVALWNSLLHAPDDRNNYREAWMGAIRDDSFLAFCRFVGKNHTRIENMANVRTPTLMTPQYRWYRKLPDDVIPLHLENIHDEFHALPFVAEEVSIPHKLKRKHATWEELKTDEIIECANKWAGEDFDKFGYQKEGV